MGVINIESIKGANRFSLRHRTVRNFKELSASQSIESSDRPFALSSNFYEKATKAKSLHKLKQVIKM